MYKVSKYVHVHIQMANCPNCPVYFDEPQAPLVTHSLNLVLLKFLVKLAHSWNTGGEPELIYCDNSYIASSASDVSVLLVCTALHLQITRRHVASSVLHLCWYHLCRYERHKLAVQSSSPSIVVAGQLQLHCLSSLNLFMPSVCAFTYLSLSIIISTAANEYLQLLLLFSCTCKLCTCNISEYTEHLRK